MATISNTPRPGYVWDSADNVWYPIGVGAHQHTNAADTPAVMPYSTYAAAGKNKIINGDFGVWQRGTTFNSITNGSYSADRFQVAWDSSPTVNVTQQTFTPGTAPVSGYESAYFFRLAETATSSSTVVDVRYRIEDVRTFAGQTATLSWWAKADSARTMTIAAINQDFGTGGSTAVSVTPTTSSFNLTTSWQRFSTTVTFPSIAGKTIGTNSVVSFFLRNTASATLVFDLWGVQFEVGSNATAFQTATGNPASELAACQRYFQIFGGNDVFEYYGIGANLNTVNANCVVQWYVPMRTAPTATFTTASNYRVTQGTSANTCTGAVGDILTKNNAAIQFTVASGLTLGNAVRCLANNTLSGTISISAEF